MVCSSQPMIMSPTTHIVDDARFVSSCFSCPSSARPLLSLLLANSGRTVYTFESVKPGPTGQPALESTSTLYITCHITPQTYHQNSVIKSVTQKLTIRLTSNISRSIRKLKGIYFMEQDIPWDEDSYLITKILLLWQTKVHYCAQSNFWNMKMKWNKHLET
jgi:hypothetical protein